MNRKKYIIAAIVAGLVAYACDFLLHGVILMKSYTQYQGLFGSMDQMMKWVWLNPIAYLSLSFALAYIFIKGYEGRGMMEGVRFGLLIGLLMSVPRFCFEVMYYPYPAIFDIGNLIGGVVTFLLVGIVLAAIYKPVGQPQK